MFTLSHLDTWVVGRNVQSYAPINVKPLGGEGGGAGKGGEFDVTSLPIAGLLITCRVLGVGTFDFNL